MHMETPRLIIRNFVHEDGGDLQEILGDSETMQYCEPAYTLPQTQKFLDSFCIASQGGVAVACKETNKVIGYILFKEAQEGVYEMGWFFNRNTWGRGYALESCKANLFTFPARASMDALPDLPSPTTRTLFSLSVSRYPFIYFLSYANHNASPQQIRVTVQNIRTTFLSCMPPSSK